MSAAVIEFLHPISIVDAGHPDRIDWRRCSISLHTDLPGHASLKVRAKRSGRSAGELFGCSAFLGQVDLALQALLCPVLPCFEDPVLERCLASRARSRGYGARPGCSAEMNFTLPDEVSRDLAGLSAHHALVLQSKFLDLSKRQERRRHTPVG